MSYQTRPLSSRTRGYLRKILPELIYLRYFSRHEKKSLDLWQFIAGKVPPESVILDIGAFQGEFALAARKVNKLSEVYAFEPNPESLEVLRPICINNQIGIVGNAISDENKTLNFRCNSQISKIVKNKSDGGVIEVKACTLDSWIRVACKIPYLIKIDVEDAAENVLRGSQWDLKKYRPIIICEILTDEIGAAAMKALPNAYHCYYINENKGLESKKVVKRYDWRYKNWMFVLEEKENLLPEHLFSSSKFQPNTNENI